MAFVKFIPAREVAALAIATRPAWSNVRLAKSCGVGITTVLRVRLPAKPDEMRIGLDNKRYPAHRKKRAIGKVMNTAVLPANACRHVGAARVSRGTGRNPTSNAGDGKDGSDHA
jgi:hypothetical protein